MLFLVLAVLLLFALPIMAIIWIVKKAKGSDTQGVMCTFFISLVLCVAFFIFGAMIAPSSDSASSAHNGLSETEYKEACLNVSYDELARTPDKYDGQLVKFKGEVVQVVESFGKSVVYRVNVTKENNPYIDLWTDTVYVEYRMEDNTPRILEGDIVVLYGESNNTVTYEAVLGNSVTIPAIKAKYIDIK